MLSLLLNFLLLKNVVGDLSGFVTTKDSKFMLNGAPFYFTGANCYNIFQYGDGGGDTETSFMNKTKIDEHMNTMAINGVTVLRTWGFSSIYNSDSGWHNFEPYEGQYDENQFAEFDYVMYSANKHNIRVIITLENYWSDYGGIFSRLAWANQTFKDFNGGQGVFFTTEPAIQSYINYITHFITRTNHYTNVKYIDDPTILAWELMNEPRYEGFGDNKESTVLRGWMDRVGAIVKALDPNHLLSSGIEGHGPRYNFGGYEGNDFITIHSSPYIDFCSAHPYPRASWARQTLDEFLNTVDLWISDCQDVIGKPMVIGEFNVDSEVRDEWWAAFFDKIETRNAGGDLFWWFQSKNDGYVDNQYGVYEGDSSLALLKEHSEKMSAKSV